MGNAKNIVKAAYEVWGMLPSGARQELAKKAGEKLKGMGNTEDDFRNRLGQMTDEELAAAYIPDVYQKDIYRIDYEKLKAQGIKLISFDIDDTIASLGAGKPSRTVLVLFKDLKRMGFTVVLLTNGRDSKGKGFAKTLGVDYVAEAKKPYSIGFKAVLFDYEERHQERLEKAQMAHVGNHLSKDVMGGNIFGITTCLVRRVGKWGKVGAEIEKLAGVNKNHIVREELKSRGLWYAHHQYEKGDQYYQLGEEPGYRRICKPGYGSAQQTADNLIQKVNANKNVVYSLGELMRNSCEQKKRAGTKTLYTHLGEDIIFTGTGDGTEDMRELEENELWEGELSAFIFTVGCYSVRQAWRVYKGSDGIDGTKREPAGKDVAAAYKERDYEARRKYRDTCEISVKYKGGSSAPSDEWVHICFADVSIHWAEKIDFICTVKSGASSPDDQAALFVLKEYMGDSFSVEHWYRFTPDGTVKEYQLHPYDEDSFKERWELK